MKGAVDIWGYRRFQGVSGPAWGAWLGETEDAALAAPSKLQEQLPTIIEAAATALQTLQDPARRVEVLKVKAAQARARGDLAQAQILEAKVRGWQRQLAIEDDALQSKREWRGLGKTLIFSGVALVIVVTAVTLTWALKKKRRGVSNAQ